MTVDELKQFIADVYKHNISHGREQIGTDRGIKYDDATILIAIEQWQIMGKSTTWTGRIMANTGEHFRLDRSNSNGKLAAVEPAPILPVTSESFLGKTIDGRFRLVARLGKGGMGQVFKAEHLHFQKTLAIKILNPSEASKENGIDRFQREAKAISRLDHANIVKVHAFGLSRDKQFYLAMDFVTGRSLAEILETEASLPFLRAIAIAIQIADGLEQAHNRGIIHRDLKPANIIVDTSPSGKDFAKIVDFGIARLTGIASKHTKELTLQGSTCGSPPYMSPEQCLGETVDSRSDIYSLGCMMFELLSGRPPFIASSSLEVMRMHIEEGAPAFRLLCPEIEIPQSLEVVVMKCLNKDPAQRYQSMAELQSDLRTIGMNLASGVPSRKVAFSPLETAKKHKKLLVTLLILSTTSIAAFSCFSNSASEFSRLSNQLAAIRDRDPFSRATKKTALLSKFIEFSTNSLAGKEIADREQDAVLGNLRELLGEINALPQGLRKFRLKSELVDLLLQLGRRNEASKLANQILGPLESYIASESAKPVPDKNLIEAASLAALRLWRFSSDKQDQIIGKCNLLIWIYLSEKRYAEAEKYARSALESVKSQATANALAEISIRQNLASILLEEGKAQEAEAELVQAWTLCKSGWTPDCPFSKNLAKSLINCYLTEGKNAEADSIRQELESK